MTDDSVTDPSPADVSAYLRATGWEYLENKNAWARFRLSTERGEAVIEVPIREHAPDYHLRIRELLRDLQLIEGREPEILAKDIRSSSCDVIRLRLMGPLQNGRISVDYGARVFHYARDLLLAAACSSISRRPAYFRKKPAAAMDYLRRAKFAPTEAGSFVLTIESSVPPRLTPLQADLFPNGEGASAEYKPEPFDRVAALTLASGTATTRQFLDEISATNQASSLVGGVEQGVSANLCDALAGLISPDIAQSLEMSFRWSAVRPVKEHPPKVVFDSHSLPLLQSMAASLRESSTLDDYDLFGPIRTLRSSDVDSGGTIQVLAMGPPIRLRMATISLDGAAYRTANAAHGTDKWIRCTGELVKINGSYHLLNPRNFSVMRDDEDVDDVDGGSQF